MLDLSLGFCIWREDTSSDHDIMMHALDCACGVFIRALDMNAAEIGAAPTDVVLEAMHVEITNCNMWHIGTYKEFEAAVLNGDEPQS